MTKKQFIKENFALVLGISLPLLLVVLFWVATIIPKMMVEPPTHDLIFVANHYGQNAHPNGTLRFGVEDGKLRAVFWEDNEKYRPYPNLYYFDVETESTHEITVVIPADVENAQTVEIPEAAQYVLSNKTLSPDGYKFDNSYRGHHGFLFLYSNSQCHAKIEKNGRVMKIPSTGTRHSGNAQFLGWVIEGGE